MKWCHRVPCEQHLRPWLNSPRKQHSKRCPATDGPHVTHSDWRGALFASAWPPRKCGNGRHGWPHSNSTWACQVKTSHHQMQTRGRPASHIPKRLVRSRAPLALKCLARLDGPPKSHSQLGSQLGRGLVALRRPRLHIPKRRGERAEYPAACGVIGRLPAFGQP